MSGKYALLAVACLLMVVAAQAQALYMGGSVEGRLKRQVTGGNTPMWMRYKQCCSIPPVILGTSRAGCFPASTASAPALADGPKNCNHTCVVQCAFKAQGLLTADGTKVNGIALAARISQLATNDTRWAPALNAASATCVTPDPAKGTTPVCTSGAFEVMTCINRQLYQKCPDTVKNPSPACTDLLARAGTARLG